MKLLAVAVFFLLLALVSGIGMGVLFRRGENVALQPRPIRPRPFSYDALTRTR